MISVNTVFKDEEIKGCWFHFCQAVKRKLFSFGLKARYNNNWDFRFWVRRFLILPLIPLDHLESAFEIIIDQMPNSDELSITKFVKYFIKQWINGQFSPTIWNHHQTDKRRTNNDVEGFHSGLAKSSLNVHPKVDEMIKQIKLIDGKSRDSFYKAQSSSTDQLQKQNEFNKNLNIELVHQEYYCKEITFEQYFEKLAHQILNQYETVLGKTENLNIEEIESLPNDEMSNLKCKTDKLVNTYKEAFFIKIFDKIYGKKYELVENKMKQNEDEPAITVKTKAIKRKVNQEATVMSKKLCVKVKQEVISANSIENPIILNVTDTELVQNGDTLCLSETTWLRSSHIDHALDFLNYQFNRPYQEISYWPTWKLQKLFGETDEVCIDPNADHVFILNVNNMHWYWNK
ncbi:hypothetical protein BpHYR1_014867 [Brachionus plicatilis]|uniref:MULE transposase domain-containing protein n=1 Tax=Brachionus plicatilis TaxID=10195 RepID=A0A3M7PMW5_BRAPC|nr:hypothetical protein BpHYR1_014867 [Brachionus plicatilis]